MSSKTIPDSSSSRWRWPLTCRPHGACSLANGVRVSITTNLPASRGPIAHPRPLGSWRAPPLEEPVPLIGLLHRTLVKHRTTLRARFVAGRPMDTGSHRFRIRQSAGSPAEAAQQIVRRLPELLGVALILLCLVLVGCQSFADPGQQRGERPHLGLRQTHLVSHGRFLSTPTCCERDDPTSILRGHRLHKWTVSIAPPGSRGRPPGGWT